MTITGSVQNRNAANHHARSVILVLSSYKPAWIVDLRNNQYAAQNRIEIKILKPAIHIDFLFINNTYLSTDRPLVNINVWFLEHWCWETSTKVFLFKWFMASFSPSILAAFTILYFREGIYMRRDYLLYHCKQKLRSKVSKEEKRTHCRERKGSSDWMKSAWSEEKLANWFYDKAFPAGMPQLILSVWLKSDWRERHGVEIIKPNLKTKAFFLFFVSHSRYHPFAFLHPCPHFQMLNFLSKFSHFQNVTFGIPSSQIKLW